jgi:hypothetical protein
VPPDASHLARPLRPGEPLDRWQLAPVEERPFLAPPEPMPAATTSRFVNAFVGVGDLPCRKLFRRTMADREIRLPERIAWAEHSFAPRLELSSFWHVPTHVCRLARCFVEVGAAGAYAVEVETCGGARLWSNRQPVARFTPFMRNRPLTAECRIELTAGRTELILLLEELCERDTTWVAGITWRDPRPARLSVPAPGGATALDRLRRTAAGARLDREAYVAEPVRLLLPEPAAEPFELALVGAGHGNAVPHIPERRVAVPAGAAAVELGRGDGFPTGYRELALTVAARGMRLRRRLAVGFTGADPVPEPAADIAGRRRQAIEHIARHGDPQIGRALAIVAVGADAAAFRELVTDTLERVERREDCSDFWMPPLLWLWRDYRQALDAAGLVERALAAILGWRYWHDEPGNDVMWFWSENHALCFHTAQYLAGQALPDAMFGNSGRTGREQAALGRERLLSWFAGIEAHGFGEWNSPAYYPIDAMGLLALHRLAGDALIREGARRCLDRLFGLIALSSLGGIPSSTQGRTYDRDLKFPALTETAALAWIAWGKGALNPMAYAVPMLCLGDYAPPDAAQRLAQWHEVDGVEARSTQGQDGARLVAWKCRDALLGTVVDYRKGEPGYQAVVAQLHLVGHPDARVWVNHPGEDDPFGTRRPSYWAGDGIMPRAAQWRSLAILHYRLDDPSALPWTHCYARRDVFEELRLEGQWLFLRAGRGLAAVMAAGGLATVDGPCASYEIRSPGRRNTWLLRVASLERFGSLDAFAAAMPAGVQVAVPGERLVFRDPEHGVVSFAWEGPLSVAGRPREHRCRSPEPVLRPDRPAPP